MYHAFSEGVTESGYHLPKEIFRVQLRHMQTLPGIRLADLAECVAKGKPLPANSLAITVDDGYENFYTLRLSASL